MKFLKTLIGSFRKIFRGPARNKRKSRKVALKSRKKTSKKMALKKSLKRVSKIKAAPRKPTEKPKPAKELPAVLVGVVTHFFSRIHVIVVKITKDKIQVGDTLLIKGSTSNFKQVVKSLQIESVEVKSAQKGQLVGLKVDREARVGDKVFKA